MLFLTDISTYAGLSGVLHGLFSFGALREALRGQRSSWLLVAGVLVKVGYEAIYGASEMTSRLIDAHVAVEAHAIGAISGLLLACLYQRIGRI